MKKSKSIPKMIIVVLVTVIGIIACSNDDDSTTVTPSTSYDITPILTKFKGNEFSYEVKGDFVVFTTKDLPDHKSPYYLGTQWEIERYEAYNGSNTAFKINPNRISSQNITLTIPLHPAKASTHKSTPLGPIGISRNGVVFFNQYAAGNSPLAGEIDSFDQYLGHPAQMGNYHYHIEPTYLTKQFGEDAFLGVLSDGFPVYGGTENGKAITNTDLDEYHGHVSITADFPDGIYHYHITSEDPYINGNGFYGTSGSVTQ